MSSLAEPKEVSTMSPLCIPGPARCRKLSHINLSNPHSYPERLALSLYCRWWTEAQRSLVIVESQMVRESFKPNKVQLLVSWSLEFAGGGVEAGSGKEWRTDSLNICKLVSGGPFYCHNNSCFIDSVAEGSLDSPRESNTKNWTHCQLTMPAANHKAAPSEQKPHSQGTLDVMGVDSIPPRDHNVWVWSLASMEQTQHLAIKIPGERGESPF